jgi:hypothetical protein
LANLVDRVRIFARRKCELLFQFVFLNLELAQKCLSSFRYLRRISEAKLSKGASILMPTPTRVNRGELQEDKITGAIERQTAKLPSSVFLTLAVSSMATSLVLQILDKRDWALFIGQWAAPFLILGNYNKMVKQHGSDARGDYSNAA